MLQFFTGGFDEVLSEPATLRAVLDYVPTEAETWRKLYVRDLSWER